MKHDPAWGPLPENVAELLTFEEHGTIKLTLCRSVALEAIFARGWLELHPAHEVATRAVYAGLLKGRYHVVENFDTDGATIIMFLTPDGLARKQEWLP